VGSARGPGVGSPFFNIQKGEGDLMFIQCPVSKQQCLFVEPVGNSLCFFANTGNQPILEA
jgi:hypothetical protein